MPLLTNESATFALRSAPRICYDDDSFDIKKKQNQAIKK